MILRTLHWRYWICELAAWLVWSGQRLFSRHPRRSGSRHFYQKASQTTHQQCYYYCDLRHASCWLRCLCVPFDILDPQRLHSLLNASPLQHVSSGTRPAYQSDWSSNSSKWRWSYMEWALWWNNSLCSKWIRRSLKGRKSWGVLRFHP